MKSLLIRYTPWRRARALELLTWCLAFVVAGTIFRLWPELDNRTTALFYLNPDFSGNHNPVVVAIYQAVPWLGRGVALLGLLLMLLVACFGLSWAGRRRSLIRRAMTLAWAMFLAVGLVVNGALKEHTARPRPLETQTFGGTSNFQPVFSFKGDCTGNCSFVSGHAATGFVLLGWALFAAPAARRRWLGYALLAGALFGAGRIMQGSHFLSDVIFSAIFVGLSCWLQRELWLHWRAWRRRRAKRKVPAAA